MGRKATVEGGEKAIASLQLRLSSRAYAEVEQYIIGRGPRDGERNSVSGALREIVEASALLRDHDDVPNRYAPGQRDGGKLLREIDSRFTQRQIRRRDWIRLIWLAMGAYAESEANVISIDLWRAAITAFYALYAAFGNSDDEERSGALVSLLPVRHQRLPRSADDALRDLEHAVLDRDDGVGIVRGIQKLLFDECRCADDEAIADVLMPHFAALRTLAARCVWHREHGEDPYAAWRRHAADALSSPPHLSSITSEGITLRFGLHCDIRSPLDEGWKFGDWAWELHAHGVMHFGHYPQLMDLGVIVRGRHSVAEYFELIPGALDRNRRGFSPLVNGQPSGGKFFKAEEWLALQWIFDEFETKPELCSLREALDRRYGRI
jgi:hypothetical protein